MKPARHDLWAPFGREAIEVQEPQAPAVRREAEEDWAK